MYCKWKTDIPLDFAEEHIRKTIPYISYVEWYYISKYQALSEEFLIEFSDKVDWYNISGYQKLSKKFIRENFDKLNLNQLLLNANLDKEAREYLNLLQVYE